MTLRTKTMLWTTVLLVVALGIVYELSRRIFLEEMTGLGEELARRRAVIAANAINCNLSELERTTYDWAVWDDAYCFADDNNDEFIKGNLTPKAIAGIRVNLMLFVNAAGEITFVRQISHETGADVPLAEATREQVRRFASAVATNSGVVANSGIVDYDGTYYLLAAHQVLTSEEKGPSRGAVVLGRILDQSEQRHLQDLIQEPFVLFRLDDPALRSECPELPDHMRQAPPIFSCVVDPQTINAYAFLRDVNGQWNYVVRVVWHRAFYAEGQKLVYYFVWSFLGIGIVIILSNLLLLRLLVLNPLSSLSSQMQRIGERGELFRRIDPYGGGELYTLARSINKMLDNLQDAQENLQKGDRNSRPK